MLDIYRIVVVAFLVTDKANQVKFFEKTFLVANISPEVILGMLLLILNGIDVDFSGRKLWWRTYTIKKALPTIHHIKLVGKKKFTAIALNPEYKIFVVYITSLSSTLLVVSLGSIPLDADVHPISRF